MTLEGFIDGVSVSGFVEGWARAIGVARPRHVHIRSEGQVVAEAIADRYRPDLLAAGKGHGHFAYRARLRSTLRPGEQELELFDAETLQRITDGPSTVVAPDVTRRAVLTVEDLLVEEAHWTDEEVAEAIGSLHLQRNYEELGPQRFVDSLYLFILGRGAEDEAVKSHSSSLRSGKITPDGLAVATLKSEERKDSSKPLPSPFDGRYPFRVY